MKVLLVLTYYHPHVSGLTIYVKRLATTLARRGHQVTVLTSRYDRALPLVEQLDGVRVIRVPVLFRVSKGVIMPSFPFRAWNLIRRHDIVSAHLPQFEASLLAGLGRLAGRPVLLGVEQPGELRRPHCRGPLRHDNQSTFPGLAMDGMTSHATG